MTNVDTRLKGFRDRLTVIETCRRNAAEDAKELGIEMKKAGLSKTEIKGIKLAVRRSFQSDETLEAQRAAEEVADALAISGTAPLFAAAAA